MRESQSKIKNVRKNVSIGVINNVVTLLLSFVVRSFFVAQLGSEYVGLNSLFANILGILSFAELGIGVAITASLYQPLQNKNYHTIRAYLNFYRKFMNAVAVSILCMGVVIGLFIPLVIHGRVGISHFNIWIFFVLYAASSAVSYLMSYKRVVLTADQNEYINSINNLWFTLFISIFQIIILILWQNYTWYLVIQVVFKIGANISINRKINKKYDDIFSRKLVEKLNSVEKKGLKRDITGMVSAKIGGIVLTSTDNILISAFIGLTLLGKYNNYTMIINGLTVVVNQVLNSLTPSIGNYRFAVDNNKGIMKLFNQIMGSNYYLVLILTWGTSLFISPFIQIWLNKNYIIPMDLVFFIIFSFGINSFRQGIISYTNAYGLFWSVRYKSLIEAGMNITLSFILIRYTSLGIAGVLIGTILTNLILNLPWEVYIVKTKALNNIQLNVYLSKYLTILLILAVSTYGGLIISNVLLESFSQFPAVLVLLLMFIIGVIVFTIVIGMLYHEAWDMVIDVLKRFRNSKK